MPWVVAAGPGSAPRYWTPQTPDRSRPIAFHGTASGGRRRAVTAYALGGVLGGLCAARVRNLLGAGPTITGSLLLLGLPLLLIALVPNGYVAGAAMVVMGLGEGVWNVLTMALRQAVIPDPLRGRVLSAIRAFGWGAASIGGALGGALAHSLGLRSPILLAGVALPAAAVLLIPVLSTTAIDQARATAAAPATT